MKIVTFGSYGGWDIGDDAMLYQDIQYMLDEIKVPISNIRIITRGIEATSYLLSALGVTKAVCVNENYTEIDKVLQWCDVVFITGGGTINTRPESISLKRMYNFAMLCKKHCKRIFLSGQTIGPLGVIKSHDELAKQLIGYCSVVTVRDFKRSMDYAKLSGARVNHIHNTVDDAFGLEGSGQISDIEIANFLSDGNVVGFNANNYRLTATKEFADRATIICDTIIERYNKKILFVHQGLVSNPDVAVSRRIYDKSKYKEKMLCKDFKNVGCRELKEIASRLESAIGSRYHFLLFVATSGIPYVGICADYYSWVKQIGFSEELGMGDFIIKPEEFSVDLVLRRFEAVQGKAFGEDLEKLNSHKNESMSLFADFLRGNGTR